MEWTLFISILHYPHLSPKHFFPEGSLLTSCLLCVCLIRCPVWACLRGYYWGNGNLLAATPLKKVTTDPQGVVGSHKLLPLPWWDADTGPIMHMTCEVNTAMVSSCMQALSYPVSFWNTSPHLPTPASCSPCLLWFFSEPWRDDTYITLRGS